MILWHLFVVMFELTMATVQLLPASTSPLCAPASSSTSSSSSSSSSSSAAVAPSCSFAAPTDGPSKAASRLVSRLRHSNAPFNANLRRTLLRVPHATLLATLRYLLQEQDWQLALPMYLSLTDTPWFNWNSELHAELVALLAMSKQNVQAQSLLEGLEGKLDRKQRIGFERALIQQYARYGLKDEALATFESLQLFSPPHLSLSSLLQAYASMDLPHEALAILQDMQQQGMKPLLKDYKAVLFSFGKCGMFDDMETLASDMEKVNLTKDCVVFNMIITTYATTENHNKVKYWLNKMLAGGLKMSVRSVNAIAKACGVLNKISSSNLFVKKDALLQYLKSQDATAGELEIVKDLLELCLIEDVVKWDSPWQVDLHSTVMGSTYVTLCCWLEEVVKRLKAEKNLPSELAIVTGWGKHSEIRGSSTTKLMIRDLLESVGSPFKVDSQNKGRLLAKPHVVIAWFSDL